MKLIKEFVQLILNETEKIAKPGAACVLIVSDDGKILAVSRKNDPTAFGLPGGKIDPGETAKKAAARELLEETGLIATDLREIYSEDDGEYITTTFMGKISGAIDTNESGVIRWVTKNVLLNGPFGNYNAKLFKAVGI